MGEHDHDSDRDFAVVRELSERAQGLARSLPAGVRRLVVRAGKHAVEVEWEIAAGGAAPAAAAAAPAAAGTEAGVPAAEEPQGHTITAPLVGTFYRSPEPGADPFVNEGGPVDAGQDICIVEAMKIMNRVQSDVSGTVTAILVNDGDMVEFGQALMVVDVDGA